MIFFSVQLLYHQKMSQKKGCHMHVLPYICLWVIHCLALIVLTVAAYANSRKGLYGACHEHLSPLHYRTHRDFSALNGSRLILGGSVLRAIVFIIKKHFFFVCWRFLKLSPVPPISYLFSCKYQALYWLERESLFLSFY